MPGCGAALLPVRCPGMESGTLLLLLLCLSPAASSQLLSGQNVCRRGVERPCYKIAYFHDVSHRLGFEEAWVTCQSDGGNLLSIETANEQQFIERLIQGLSAGDGDFWIGLWRRENGTQSLSDCSGLYQWLDGSDSKFRNWYVDEPSCGREVCVVMYHQPSASSGMGGPYLYQWNDDRCNMKNNFICKYAPENTLNILYIIIPTIPLLLLLLLISAVFCFRLFVTRRKERCEVTVKEHNFWMDPVRSSSPNLEVYSVIMKQSQADLTGARPHIKNTSFQTSPHSQDPDNVSRDYDNVAANCPSSGFVTNEIYEPYQAQVAMGRESGWVENEIYGY
ncbi:layilin isoform X2 [Scyliorhinus torazame]|uniref:layilin isoform X2 n=1 Tax=Scyliorhinus torazame TaxID=75743 RepID=UPI003B5ADE81